jgi:DNA-binding HxlR family transcriptional regulator
MAKPQETRPNCSVAGTLAIVGERWTLLILREAFMGVRRFEQMQRNLGVARNILAARLQTLVGHGILERRRYQERPDRYEYRLSQKGLDLYPALVSIMQWGDRYLNDDCAPVTLVHKSCGHETQPRLACSHCGEPVGARDVRAEAGPGALAKSA